MKQIGVHQLDPQGGADGQGIVIAAGRFTVGDLPSGAGGGGDGRVSAAVSLSSAPRGTTREHPTLTKPLTAPIFDQADSAAASIYWPVLVDQTQHGGSGVALMYSTDHAAVHADSGIFKATATDPLNAFTDTGLVYRDDTSGAQTETPSLLWDETSDLWRMYYQQDNVGRGDQSTLMATSTDLTVFTRVGIVAEMRTTTEAGDGHTGYFRPWRYGSSWRAFSLYGGGSLAPGFGVWSSPDGVTWQADLRRLGYFGDLIDHLDGYAENDWRIKWFHGDVFEWRGRLWWIGLVGPASSGGTVVDHRICAAPLSRDLRAPAERPIDITPAAQGWESGIDGLGNIFAWDGRLFIPYRSGGATGAFGVMEVV